MFQWGTVHGRIYRATFTPPATNHAPTPVAAPSYGTMEDILENEDEAPAPLPPLPRPTEQGLPEARDHYMLALVTALADWTRWRNETQPGLAAGRQALLDLETYGLWAWTATARTKHWWGRTQVGVRRAEGDHQHIAPVVNWFWEWMHLRHYVAEREAEARPDRAELADARVQDSFPALIRLRLAVARPTPVAAWTQRELDGALQALLMRWQTVPWQPGFDGYVHALLDRLAALGWARLPPTVLDLPDGRLAVGNEPGRPETHTLSFDWQFRAAHRTLHLLRGLYLQAEAGERVAPDPGTLELPATAPTPITAADLRLVLATRARAAGADTRVAIQKEAVALALPPEDPEWLRFLKPTATVVPATMLEELHEPYKDRIQKASWRRPHAILAVLTGCARGNPKALVEQGLAERVALRLLDGALPAHLTPAGDQLAWSAVHAYANPDLEESKGSRSRRQLPALVQWQGRYELVWRGRTFAHADLYEALADWFRLVAAHYAHTHEWRILAPAVEEVVARQRQRERNEHEVANEPANPPADPDQGPPEAGDRRPHTFVLDFSKRART